MENKEKELITEDLVADPMCYNIALGGQGGNLGKVVNEKIGEIMSKVLLGKPKTEAHKKNIGLANKGKVRSESFKNNTSKKTRERMSQLSEDERKSIFGHSKELNGFYGKKHTPESIEQMKRNKKFPSGAEHPCAKPVTINGVTYSTRKECMSKLGISKKKLYKLLGEN
jgi:hypothetical protein